MAIAALLMLGVLVWALGGVLVTRHRATSAADLAALAAAGTADLGRDAACHRAGRIAERMQVRLRGCRLAGWDALVVVEAVPPGALAGFGTATAKARAGPVGPGEPALGRR